jgi:hypothetical protein
MDKETMTKTVEERIERDKAYMKKIAGDPERSASYSEALGEIGAYTDCLSLLSDLEWKETADAGKGKYQSALNSLKAIAVEGLQRYDRRNGTNWTVCGPILDKDGNDVVAILQELIDRTEEEAK